MKRAPVSPTRLVHGIVSLDPPTIRCDDRTFTVTLTAEQIDLHPRTLRRAIAAGELPAYKFGSALRVRLDELDAWAESKAMPNPRTTRPTLSGGASL